ncbi:MAG: CapA family protein [Cyanobacteria bacterium J06633_23]
MVNTPVDINQVKQSAASGHFRSIALWLNYPLVPQAIYARVQTDPSPGYLQVLLEFERPPKKDALIRLVCNRLCRLESDLIRGVTLIGRPVGTDRPLWQQRIKLISKPTPKQGTARPATPPVSVPPAPPEEPLETTPAASSAPKATPTAATTTEQRVYRETVNSESEAITTTTYGSDALNNVPSYLIPRKSNNQERRRRPNRSVAPAPVVQIRPATIDINKTSIQRRTYRRRLVPKAVIDQQFKYLRAIVVTGSAAAAFILGCMTEAITSQRGQVAQKEKPPTLPTFNNGGWRPLDKRDVQEIAYRSAMRSPAVPAALEPVAVMPHAASSDPNDPTVTLMFGGEVPVGDVPLQTPDAVGKVLSDLDMFREADVAMVGLGNSLAIADTSLQENYLDRTRPEAVDSLRQGGIDIVGLSGDQIMDYGRHGLTETLESLDGAGIYRVGAGRNRQEARRPEVLEVKGQRIAYLSYAPNSDEAATLAKAGLNIQERDGIIEDISALREAVDWIVVNYRWYGDLETEPNAQQVNLSRSAIDAGADLVVGYHPQQIQGAELYKSRPIVYSLGDFVFQDAPLDDHDTATLRVSLREKQMKIEFLPVSVREARPREASGETAKAILKQIRQASDALPSPLQFPAILDAPPQKGPLLKPDKPIAPAKTLGELEPGLTEYPSYGDEGVTPGPEIFIPETFDELVPESDRFTPDTFDELVPEPNHLTPDTFNSPEAGTFAPNHLNTPEPEGWGEPIETTPVEIPATSPLETFNTQPDQSLELEPKESWESPLEAAPKVDSVAPQVSPDAPVHQPDADDGAVTPQQSDDILLPSETPLPGYDTLENWGEKSSPHKEFNPIEEHSNSLESLDIKPSGEPAVSFEGDNSDTSASEAISPHDEPLVGPLSQQPANLSTNKLAS